jgi:hypothetical protein
VQKVIKRETKNYMMYELRKVIKITLLPFGKNIEKMNKIYFAVQIKNEIFVFCSSNSFWVILFRDRPNKRKINEP